MSLLRASRQAEELSAALAGGGAPRDARLRVLVSVVEQLRTVPQPRISPDFSHQLRDHLMTAARTELTPSAATETSTAAPQDRWSRSARAPRIRRRLSRLVATVVVAASAVGLVAGSAQALPGDVLYPLKRAGESIELAVARGPAAEGRVNLEHAETRLTELASLTVHEDVDTAETTRLVGSTLEDFTEQATDGGSGLITSFEAEGDQADLVEIDEFTVRAIDALRRIAPALPRDSGAQFAGAAGALEVLTQDVDTACPSCPSDPAQAEDLDALLEAVGDVVAQEALPVSASPEVNLPAPVMDTPGAGTEPTGDGGNGSGGGNAPEQDDQQAGNGEQQGGAGDQDGAGGHQGDGGTVQEPDEGSLPYADLPPDTAPDVAGDGPPAGGGGGAAGGGEDGGGGGGNDDGPLGGGGGNDDDGPLDDGPLGGGGGGGNDDNPLDDSPLDSITDPADDPLDDPVDDPLG